MIISNINIRYGENIIFKDFKIDITENKVICIIGKSGIGKTTLLKYICNELLMKNIKFSYVFQEDRLIPWLNIYENLKLIAKQQYKGEQLDKKISEVHNIVKLNEFTKYFPNELSGGMRQRVNIARALLRNDKIILMDEPFKSIDSKCKYSIMEYIKKLQDTTLILVTHNREEVRYLADIVYLLGDNPISCVENINIKEINNIIV